MYRSIFWGILEKDISILDTQILKNLSLKCYFFLACLKLLHHMYKKFVTLGTSFKPKIDTYMLDGIYSEHS